MSTAPHQSPVHGYSSTLLVLLICVGAAGLRLHGLDVQSLWHDELFSWYASQLGSLGEAVDFGAAQDVHPPGFIVFMFGWQGLAGGSETALRLPAALAGIGACGWMFVLGRRWFSERVGITAAALLALSWPAIYYSQEARAYSLMLLCCIAVVERTLAILQPDSRHGHARWMGLACLSLLTITLSYLHYFGLLFVAFSLLGWGAVAARRRSGIASWAIVSGATLLAYLPWVTRVLSQVDRGKIWIPPPTLEGVLGVYSAMTNQHLGPVVLLWMAGALAGGLWATRQTGQSTQEWLRGALLSPVAWLIGWVTVPMLVTLVISAVVLPVLTERNLLIMLPGIVLLTALALCALERWTHNLPVFTVVIGLAMLADLTWVQEYYEKPTKWQYRAVAESIVEQAPAGHEVYVVSGAWHPSYFDYYFDQMGAPVRVGASGRGRKQLRKKAEKAPLPVVFVAAPAGKKAKRQSAMRLRGYVRKETREFVGWDLYRFERASRSQ